MKALSGRDFARLIERRGWQLLRVSGSHHIYGKAGSAGWISLCAQPILTRWIALGALDAAAEQAEMSAL